MESRPVNEGITARKSFAWLLIALTVIVLHGWSAQTALANDIEQTTQTFLAGVKAYDETTLEDLVADQVVILGLQPLLKVVYQSWQERVLETEAIYFEGVAMELSWLFQDYMKRYYPGMDPLHFLMHDVGSPGADEYAEQWDDIWYHVVREHSAEWDDEFGPDWDEAELEAMFYEMYLASLEWEDEWDDYADEFISPGEMAMLEAVAELLEVHRPQGHEEEFVRNALAVVKDYALSDAAWRDAMAWAVANYYWLPPSAAAITETGDLAVSGSLLVTMLLQEGLSWEDGRLSVNDETTSVQVMSGLSGEEAELTMHWQVTNYGWQVTAVSSEWAGELRWVLDDLSSWLGF